MSYTDIESSDFSDVQFRFRHIFYYLFLFLCMFPFLFGNPFFETDMQPYALVLAVIICLFNIQKSVNQGKYQTYFYVSLFTIFMAILVLLFGGISLNSVRGFYNYCAIFFIPWAIAITFYTIGGFPERFIKFCIITWFIVGSVQFFVDRSFAISLVGTVRWTDLSRGVVGLSSEPSYYGITCFYFLLMTQFFTKRKWLYVVMIIIMGVLFAQSSLGIVFIGVYWLFYLMDNMRSRRGWIILIASIAMLFGFIFLLETKFANTRMSAILTGFINEGVVGVEDDSSIDTRYNSIVDAMQDAFGNYLIPIGFRERIGSAYGGFLCELGIFAVPLLFCISRFASFTFSRAIVRFLFFMAFTVLMFNNTQLGNPLLLFAIVSNCCFSMQMDDLETETEMEIETETE